MPRNSNGTYTLPAGNPVVSGEVISTSWANPTMEDLANEITNSLDRSGRGGMMAPFKNYDGTQSSPGITWGNEPTTGFWRNAAQDMRVSVGGQPRMRWTAAGNDIWNGTIWSEILSVATLPAQLTGYPLKAVAETITGSWTFTPAQTFDGTLNARAVTIRSGSVLTVLDAANVTSLTAGNDGVSGGWVRHPNQVTLQIDGFGPALTATSTLTSVSGAFSAPGAGSFGGTLNVTGAATFQSTIAAKAAIVFDSDSAVIGPAYRTVAGVQRWLNGRDPADNGWKLWRYDTAGAFLNTPLVIGGDGNALFEGNVNVAGTLKRANVDVVLTNRTITGINTVQGGGDLSANRTFQLVNDVASPGSSWYYGTDAAGAKGWFPLSGVVGVPEAPVDGTAYARQNASWVSIGSGGVYVLKTGDTMSGSLTISYPGPHYTMYDTAGPADAKRFSLIQTGGYLYFRLPNDVWDNHTDFLTVSRSGYYATTIGFAGDRLSLAPAINGDRIVFDASNAVAGTGVVVRATDTFDTAFTPLRLQGSQVDFCCNSTSQPVAQANAAGLEVLYGKYFTCFNADNSTGLQIVTIGTTGYIAGSVGDIAIQVGGSNAMTFAGAYAAILGDRTFRFYNPANTDFAHFRLNSSNNFDFVGPSSATRFDFYLSGGSDWIASFNKESLTIKQNTSGFAALRLQKNDLNFGAAEGTSLEFYEGGVISGWIRCLRDGLGTMQIHNTQSGALDLNTNGAVIFTIAGSIYADMSSGSFNMYDGKPIRLYNSGNVKNSELAFTADNGGNQQIRLCGRGGAWHWNSTSLTAGDVTIQTTDPAASGGRFGQIVLVYE